MGRFSGKTVIVTGGASGIGLATAQRIVAEGGHAAIFDRDQHTAEESGRRLAADGNQIAPTIVDVSDPKALAAAAEAVQKQAGSVDGLFANAGVSGRGASLDIPLEQWHQVIDVDLTGAFFSMQAVLPMMVAQQSGAIVTTASVAAIMALPAIASYTAAKAGVIAVTRQVAVDYGKDGIRANSICPGTVRTQMTAGTYTWAAGGDPQAGAELLEARANTIALGRLGTPEDVAALVTFLLSDDASWLTGGNYVVDGGLTIGMPGARTPIA